jgi:CRP/FNR family transcriptional regulator
MSIPMKIISAASALAAADSRLSIGSAGSTGSSGSTIAPGPRGAGPQPLAPPAPPPGDFRVSALEHFLGSDAKACMPAGVSPFALVHVAQGAPLVHEGAPVRCVYVVQAGSFKTVRTGEDGYEQVLDFVGRHDVIGCDGLANGHHASGALALEESWAYALPLADIRRLAHERPAFNDRWLAAMAAQITRASESAWLIAAVGAEKRVARFLLLLARRMAERGESPRRLRLRMCRRDIASHLGLAHESVSRSFSMLADMRLLRVDNREIEILDDDALRTFASCTRGYPQARRDVPARAPQAALVCAPQAALVCAPQAALVCAPQAALACA